MIRRDNKIKINNINQEQVLNIEKYGELYKDALFFDLEHYVYKKPVCVGVFGCCYYDEAEGALIVTQYMIENSADAIDILHLAKDYFTEMLEKYNKKYIVTFSGNNDYTVINYLFNKYKIGIKIEDYFNSIDLQKEYEKEKGNCIGLKALEKEFDIIRDSELISGSNLAKTFHKIMKDKDYADRMPECKKEKILLYNEQDVVSLFHIYTSWKKILQET